MPARLTFVSRIAVWLLGIVFGAGLLALTPSGAQDGRSAVVLHIEGAIGMSGPGAKPQPPETT